MAAGFSSFWLLPLLVDMALLLVTLWNFWMNLWFNWRVDKTPARNAA
ncbi:MAG: hypothetical protein IH623_18630 [Verrucomicrobia bacterium]|nr:hypothetical protein [Verrucomicrobiota bacterium]